MDKPLTRQIQRGFTLVELVVVVTVLGILFAVVSPSVLGPRDGANAKLMIRAASSVAQNWTLANQACGTTTVVASNPLILATKTASDVVFGGSTNVAAAYTTCYAQAKVLALTELSTPSGTAGVYNVAGYNVTMAGGGTSTLSVAFLLVPDALALLIAQQYTPTLAALAASDATSPVVQYSTATAGTRTVTVLKQI